MLHQYSLWMQHGGKHGIKFTVSIFILISQSHGRNPVHLGHGQVNLLKFIQSIRIGKKGDLSDYELLVHAAKRTGRSISKTTGIFWHSYF